MGWGVRPAMEERAGLGRQRQVGTVRNDHQADWALRTSFHRGCRLCLACRRACRRSSGFPRCCGVFRSVHRLCGPSNTALSRGNYHWHMSPVGTACARDTVRDGAAIGQSTLANRQPEFVWRQSGRDRHRAWDAKAGRTHAPPILDHTERGDRVYDPFLGSDDADRSRAN
jgi:hypothetical protein